MKIQKWEKHYDKDCDHLYVGVYPMKKDAKSFKLNEYLSVYITPDGEIHGIFVEYYKYDFVKRFKQLIKRFRAAKPIKRD